jgi:hypothetical protein
MRFAPHKGLGTLSAPRLAARLTIVGGRPPSDREVIEIPRGIELAVQRAAVDRRFRARLLTDRASAVSLLGDVVSATERQILLSIPDDQLAAMIEGAAPIMPARRSLLMRFAGALGLFIGGGLAGTATSCMKTKGETADVPRERTKGERADMPPPSTRRSAGIVREAPRSPATEGIRPDVPPSTKKAAAGEKTDATARQTLPDKKDIGWVSQGVRADEPKTTKTKTASERKPSDL